MPPDDATTAWFAAAADGYRGASRFDAVRASETRVVLDFCGTVTGLRVLELGCGDGHYARALASRGAEVVAVDAVPEMVAAARAQGVDAVVGDAATVQLGSFDLVVIAGMLEFADDVAAVLANAATHADGAVVLVPTDDPAGWAYRAWHRSHGVRIRLFSSRRLRDWAEGAGFRVARTRRAGAFARVARLERT